MAIVIVRTIMLDLVVTAEEEIRTRVPFFAGDVLQVQRVYDHDDGRDWLAPLEGGVIPVPPDAWQPCWA